MGSNQFDQTELSSLKKDTHNTVGNPPDPLKPGSRGTQKKRSFFRKYKGYLPIMILVGSVFIFTVSIGLFTGYLTGNRTLQARMNEGIQGEISNQYRLGIEDIAEGNLEIARQRIEYVISNDPSYPGAAEMMAEILYNLYATATPLPAAPTGTPSPTHDPRPAQEMFMQAESYLAAYNWDAAINQLIALRKENPAYETARVDGMMYLALRYRGVEKILKLHNLVGGIYDLALAENFARLDIEARNTREWARIYLIGSSFWEIFPQQAAYYFGQVASAAPYLRDGSGWTAVDRYWLSLIHYGDQLAREEKWCDSQVQYELAYSIRGDMELLRKIEEVSLLCAPPDNLTPTTTWTVTPTLTGTITVFPTPSTTLIPTFITSTPTATSVLPTYTPVPPTSTPTVGPPTTEPSPPPQPTATPEPTSDSGSQPAPGETPTP